MKFKHYLSSLSLLIAFSSSFAWSVPIAIIDSGTDWKHPDLEKKIWINAGEVEGDGIDNDQNGYIDDVRGWNFAENNGEIIDYSYLGKFSPDVTKFFEVQTKILLGTETEEDKEWLASKKKDTKFIKELSTFGNFVHGTHVAGIAAQGADHAKIMAEKLIPTEIKAPGTVDLLNMGSLTALLQPNFQYGLFGDFLFRGALWLIANQQGKQIAKIGDYTGKMGMKAANCSFGTSVTQSKMIVRQLAKAILQKDLTEEEAESYAAFFIEQVLQSGKAFVEAAPETLFVMAAGNDGTDNDQLPVFPANLKEQNVITVAATRGYERLASFSNFGAQKVDIAAPGVGIISSIPGGEKLPLSGTSQATPFVTQLVGRVMDANPALSLAEVKEIVIKTVDRKEFLKGKVTSEGIANPERALYAAQLSTQQSIADSIEKAQSAVHDVQVGPSLLKDTGNDGEPIALPSLFKVD